MTRPAQVRIRVIGDAVMPAEPGLPGRSAVGVAVDLGRLGHRVSFLTCPMPGPLSADRLATAGVELLLGRAAPHPETPDDSEHGPMSPHPAWSLSRQDPAPAAHVDILHTGSRAATAAPDCAAVLFMVRAMEEETVVSFAADIRSPRDCAVTLSFIAAADIVTLSESDAAWLFPGMSVDEVIDRVLRLGPALVAVTHAGGADVGTRRERWSAPDEGADVVAGLLHAVATMLAHGSTANDLRDRGFDRLRRRSAAAS